MAEGGGWGCPTGLCWRRCQGGGEGVAGRGSMSAYLLKMSIHYISYPLQLSTVCITAISSSNNPTIPHVISRKLFRFRGAGVPFCGPPGGGEASPQYTPSPPRYSCGSSISLVPTLTAADDAIGFFETDPDALDLS